MHFNVYAVCKFLKKIILELLGVVRECRVLAYTPCCDSCLGLWLCSRNQQLLNACSVFTTHTMFK